MLLKVFCNRLPGASFRPYLDIYRSNVLRHSLRFSFPGANHGSRPGSLRCEFGSDKPPMNQLSYFSYFFELIKCLMASLMNRDLFFFSARTGRRSLSSQKDVHLTVLKPWRLTDLYFVIIFFLLTDHIVFSNVT